VHGPWFVAIDEQLALLAREPLQAVVDGRCGDHRRQRPKVAWRRAGHGGELAEAPVRQGGGPIRRVPKDDVVIERLGRQRDRGGAALFEAEASGASRVVECWHAGVPFIGWAGGPLAMRGVRGDSGHTCAGHGVLLSQWPWGDEWNQLLRRATRRGGQDGHNGMIRG
jgi:hypothetical protein